MGVEDRSILEVRANGKLHVRNSESPVWGFKQNVFGVALIIVTEAMVPPDKR